MRSTIRQVAERAGVSRMTVTNVLRGRTERVSDETRARVLGAARDLEYAPVAGPAMQGRHVRTHVIGLVFDILFPTRSDLGFAIYEGVMEAASDCGYDLLTILRAEPAWMQDRSELHFLDRRVDGYIFINDMLGGREKVLETLVKDGVRAVICLRREVPPGVAWVGIDNAGAMRLAVGRLVDLGHRRIAHLAGNLDASPGRARVEEFKRAIASYGLDLAECRVHGRAWELRQKDGQAVLDSRVTAVVCVNDHIAVALWKLADQVGRAVPKTLSIVGVDNEEAGRAIGLTTIAVSPVEAGRAAVEAIVAMLGGASPEQCSRDVSVTLLERSSIAAPCGA